MGGGDLNLKKSFHPTLRRNQAAVYDEEQKALAERKRTQQRIDEIKEERAKEELQRQLEAAGGKKRVDRVDWMYQGPTDGQADTKDATAITAAIETESAITTARAGSDVIRVHGLEARAGAGLILTTTTEALDGREVISKNEILDVAVIQQTKDMAGETTHIDTMTEAPEGREMTLTNAILESTRAVQGAEDMMCETTHAEMTTGRPEESATRTLGNRDMGLLEMMALATATQMTEEEIGPGMAEMVMEDITDAASELDQDRSDRLAAIDEKDRLARDADDKARERNGDRAFANGLHQQAGDLDLGARMGRNKHGFQKDDD
ncbi:hypothetical protein LMH87_011034 [Akanthomyces muscarius]|uniref:CBF1-interacting co-repressor CIR N-terminal domain-containing protein n=1 Tax=Akanthomyces muscarius TaxID=2231603 RepID=A0A9W8UJK7_AKAMU|nr:hypothetical protein LMH87_011034 [Akanthomyces muscarius]KAJ4150277.1 hypothetical protein LMH87_011034 [Akanthomyces muscarius]